MSDLLRAVPPAPVPDDAQARAQEQRRQEAEAHERFARLLVLAQRGDTAARAGRYVAGEGGRMRAGAFAADGRGSVDADIVPPDDRIRGDGEPQAAVAAEAASGARPMVAPPPRKSPPARRMRGSVAPSSAPPDVRAEAAEAAPAPAAPPSPGPGERDPGREFFERLGRQLETLCRRSVSGPEGWTVTLALDPEVLPEAELRIRASQSWLRLRFSTQSARSVQIVLAHAPLLERQLEEALDMKQQIDIDFE